MKWNLLYSGQDELAKFDQSNFVNILLNVSAEFNETFMYSVVLYSLNNPTKILKLVDTEKSNTD